MDLTTNHNLNQHHHHQQQQQQQQHLHQLNPSTSSAIGTPGQLPDESYIEKLFPKCQPPKQQNQKNKLAATSTTNRMNGSGRLPQRRQNRAKMQQQQQQQHQQRKMNTTLDNFSGTKDKSNQKSHNNLFDDLNTNQTNTGKKANEPDYSSASSDNDSLARGALLKGDKNYSGYVQGKNATIGENKSQIDTEQQQQNYNNRPRARRYKATKNLQPRFRRTQSSQSRFGAQSNEPKNQNEDEKSAPPNKLPLSSSSTSTIAPSSSNSIATSSPPAAAASSTSIPINLNTSGLATCRIPPTSEPAPPIDQSNQPKINDNIRRKSEGKTISRTCRGIVFSESLQTFNSDDLISDQLIAPTTAAAFTAHDDDAGPPIQSPLAMDPIAQQALLNPPTMRQITTADVKSGEFGEDNVDRSRAKSPEPIITTSTVTSFGFYDSSPEHNQQTSYATKDNDLLETKLSLHEEDNLKDDDRYINLFVYDNTGPQGKTEDLEDPSGLNQNYELASEQEEQISSIDARASHKFFAEDLNENEQDVIKNDTSIEELCNFEEDISNSVQSSKTHASVNDTTEDITSEGSSDIPEFTSKLSASNKSHSKHRLLGTLQTVDEKAEINADNGTHSATVGPEAFKTELIDIGDNNSTMPSEDGLKMVRRGGGPAPPGFPRRVRPNHQQQQVQKPQDLPSNKMHESQLKSHASDLAKDPSSSDIRPDQVVSVSDESFATLDSNRSRALISPLTEDQVKVDVTESGLTRPEESDDVGQRYIEDQLSGSLNKVSLANKLPDPETSEQFHTANSSQHHKLPNETSHFSILRSVNRVQTSQPGAPEVLRSRIQFNTLSDGDSETDDKPNVIARTNKVATSRTLTDKKLDRPQASYSNTSLKDDDLAPTNKTALIFPRLDEGLSSDAESCADEEDEDDERAIEADVDADDEEGNEDEADSPIRTNGRGSGAGMLGSDNFLRQQPQTSSRIQGRFLGSAHQISSSNSMSAIQASDIDAQQIKQNPNSQYSNFINASETLDQNELKNLSGYPNHNGQSNYWMGVASQTALSTQPSSVHGQQQYPLQRNQQHGNANNGNNINLSRSNSYINRDEAKSVNRLSSDTDNETDRLLGSQRNDQLQKINNSNNNSDLVSSNSATDNQIANSFGAKPSTNSKEVLIEGVLFNVKYLGSTHTECEGRGEKEDRIHQAELAVHEVKFRDGDPQTPVEVQLFISTEKIMVLDDKHRKIMMDHSLRTISYIADIGDAIVLIVRKKSTSMDMANEMGRPISKTSCHVFESNESHTITKSISQAFQVAYTELLKANGATDSGSYLPKELDYQEVLNSQEMSTTELEMFARKDNQREVIVPKQKGEILGLSIVESGWGSVLPTAVIASLKQDGPAYRCKKLSVGDQILSINGISLVGLSLAECQKILRKTKNQSVARLSVVPCPITVEVKIKRPDTKYQLGFSVQHGVICSLLRGGIAERGGVRVGHRIISINGTTVVGVPHDKIVTLLASSVGEIRMKTCLTSLYRHMLGEEKNVSFV